jgi:hypothetical protein
LCANTNLLMRAFTTQRCRVRGGRTVVRQLNTDFDCIPPRQYWATRARACGRKAALRSRKRVKSRPGAACEGRTGEGRKAAHASEKDVALPASAGQWGARVRKHLGLAESSSRKGIPRGCFLRANASSAASRRQAVGDEDCVCRGVSFRNLGPSKTYCVWAKSLTDAIGADWLCTCLERELGNRRPGCECVWQRRSQRRGRVVE